MSGNIGNKPLNIKNYTIGNSNALDKFAQVVNNQNSLSGETISLLEDITTNNAWEPIGYCDTASHPNFTGKSFSGTFEGNGHTITIPSVSTNIQSYDSTGLFGFIDRGIINNVTVEGKISGQNTMIGRNRWRWC